MPTIEKKKIIWSQDDEYIHHKFSDKTIITYCGLDKMHFDNNHFDYYMIKIIQIFIIIYFCKFIP